MAQNTNNPAPSSFSHSNETSNSADANAQPIGHSSHKSVRVEWVDYAKGFCIIFVVMMHSTLGVGEAAGQEGWMHYVVAWAQPFRMPDFFMVAGLFLSTVIDRNWRHYLDKKLLHFAYFYVLWTLLQFGIKIPANLSDSSVTEIAILYVRTFIEPYSTLWFIYMLPIMFIITKALRPVSALLVLAVAALLEIAPISTGYLLIDEFASRYVYFFAGYLFAPHIFKAADWVQKNKLVSVFGLLLWATINGVIVFGTDWHLPGLNLVLGAAGAFAIIAISSLLVSIKWADVIRYCGQHSLVIYLAFFFPMAVSRVILLKVGVIDDIGTMSALVTLAAVTAPLVLYLIIDRFGFGQFLFVRPQWATLKD